MKKRSRCVRCGHFIRNHSFCKACVVQYRTWKAWMDTHPYGINSKSAEAANARRKRLIEMEAEMEH